MNEEQTTVFISDVDQYLFGQGTHYDIHKKLGAHVCHKGKKKGVFFAVWAPNAKEAYVLGEFNDWSESAAPMKRIGQGGIFATFIEDVKEGQLYKYMFVLPDGRKLYKADPYANYAEMRPGVRRHIVGGANGTWISVLSPPRLCRTGTRRRLSAG